MATKERKRAKLPPHVALDAEKQKEFNQKTQQAKKKAGDGSTGPGVIYISHLPWGFVEQPLRDFFKQFGKVQKLRISRSKKTGNSKGYAYLQFANVEVAKIAAETMNNYLVFDKLIKCKYLQNPHPGTFKNAERAFYKPKGPRKAIEVYNQPKTQAALKKSKAKSVKTLSKTKKKLEELGIDYSVEITGVTDPAVEVKEEPESETEDTEEKSVQKKAIERPRKAQAKDRITSAKTKGKNTKTVTKGSKVKVEKENQDTCNDVVEIKDVVSDTEPSKVPKRQLRSLPTRQKTKKQKR